MNVLINSGRAIPFFTIRRKLISSIIEKGHRVIVTGYQDGYEKEIEELGASFIKVPFNRAGFNPFKDISLIIKYHQIIKREQIDLVHSYTIKPNIYGSIAARLAGIKEVFPTLNGIGFAFTGTGTKARIARTFASILYWIAFKCSKAIFFHNSDDIDLMVKARLTKADKCVLTLGSGIDMEYYAAAEMPHKISFILISRLLKAKGILEYIKAAQKVKQQFPEIVFGLVGPTDPNPTGIKLSDIQNYIDDDVIHYHGSQSDVRPFIRDAAVLVLPSYREGVPHTVLEAMSTGRAILTTDVAGCRETVVNGKNGFLVRPYAIDDLGEKMIWMIENPKKVKEMGKNSLLMAKEKFEEKKVNSIILNTMNLL
jgi:glycosyltransferase involved in cell wall biosynthesis